MVFVTTGVYGLMRHPAYSFLMLGLFIAPTMVIIIKLLASTCHTDKANNITHKLGSRMVLANFGTSWRGIASAIPRQV